MNVNNADNPKYDFSVINTNCVLGSLPKKLKPTLVKEENRKSIKTQKFVVGAFYCSGKNYEIKTKNQSLHTVNSVIEDCLE